jgi:hypothetical protein
MLRVAAAAQALEAAGLCVAAVAQVVEAVSGHSYRASSAAGLAVMELITAALVAWIATGITRLRPWSRTPAVMTQLGCGVLAIILLQAHRADWGLPVLVVAIVGLAGLFHPASLKALARPREDFTPAAPAAAPAAPSGKRPATSATQRKKAPSGNRPATSATQRKKKSSTAREAR